MVLVYCITKGEGKIIDTILRSKFAGERHLPMWVDGKSKVTLYTGPNTALETRLKDFQNNLPINKIDRYLYLTIPLTLWQKIIKIYKKQTKRCFKLWINLKMKIQLIWQL